MCFWACQITRVQSCVRSQSEDNSEISVGNGIGVWDVIRKNQMDSCFHRGCHLKQVAWEMGIGFMFSGCTINDSPQRDPLQDGKVTAMQEFTMKQAELEKVHVKIVQLMAEQRKLNAEAGNNKDIP